MLSLRIRICNVNLVISWYGHCAWNDAWVKRLWLHSWSGQCREFLTSCGRWLAACTQTSRCFRVREDYSPMYAYGLRMCLFLVCFLNMVTSSLQLDARFITANAAVSTLPPIRTNVICGSPVDKSSPPLLRCVCMSVYANFDRFRKLPES